MVKRSGKCSCGQCTVTANMQYTINCYCSNCRRVYDADYATAGICWGWGCKSKGKVDFVETKSPYFPFTGVKRGSCSECKQPVWSSGYGLYFPFAFVNYTLFESVGPNFHFFFNSRNTITTPRDSVDPRKTYWSDLSSVMASVFFVAYFTVKQLFVCKDSVPEKVQSFAN